MRPVKEDEFQFSHALFVGQRKFADRGDFWLLWPGG
jgi:hypothetical protein